MVSAGNITAGQAFVRLGVDDKGLKSGLKKAINRLRQFAQASKKSVTKMGPAFLVVAKIAVAAFRTISRAMLKMAKIGGAVSKAIGRSFQKLRASLTSLNSGIKQVGRSLLRLGTIGAAGIATAATIFGQFDDTLRFTKAVAGGTEEEFAVFLLSH